MAIEADHYRETEAKLMRDPIIKALAQELKETGENTKNLLDNGTPRWDFMMACATEYRKRGGTIDSHIGGPGRAVLNLLEA